MASYAFETARQSLLILLPELLLLAVATVMMTLGAFKSLPRRVCSIASAIALAIALIALLALAGQDVDQFAAPVSGDAFSFYSRLVLLLTGLIFLGLAHDQVGEDRAPEFFGCLLVINAGSMITACANELVLLYVGLELVSIPTYLLLFLPKRDVRSLEAVTKYFFLSIFSSGLLLFGMAYFYGLTGISNLKGLAFLIRPPEVASKLPLIPNMQLGLVALIFMLAGFGFRVAAVPFHFYAPDVYQGSPTIIAALLAWIPKAIGSIAICRTLVAMISATGDDIPLTSSAVFAAWLISIATMTLGNTVALMQDNLKRLFAYSSIAHAGYLMIGVTVAFRNTEIGAAPSGSESLLYYLLSYGVMTLGAFGVIIALNTAQRPVETVDDLSGLKETHPGLAAALAICVLSLAGIPPLAGFIGKFSLFASALSATNGEDAWMFIVLALAGAINSAFGAYYYLRIVVVMYFRPRLRPVLETKIAWPTRYSIAACAGLTVIIGLASTPVMSATRKAAESLLARPLPAGSQRSVSQTTKVAELGGQPGRPASR